MKIKNLNESKNMNIEDETNKLQSIEIPRYYDTWSAVDRYEYNGINYYLMENDKWGDETTYLVITSDFKHIYETYDDIETCLRDEGILTESVKNESSTSENKYIIKGYEVSPRKRCVYKAYINNEEEAIKKADEIANKLSDVKGKNFTEVIDSDNEQIYVTSGKYDSSSNPRDVYNAPENKINESMKESYSQPTVEEISQKLQDALDTLGNYDSHLPVHIITNNYYLHDTSMYLGINGVGFIDLDNPVSEEDESDYENILKKLAYVILDTEDDE